MNFDDFWMEIMKFSNCLTCSECSKNSCVQSVSLFQLSQTWDGGSDTSWEPVWTLSTVLRESYHSDDFWHAPRYFSWFLYTLNFRIGFTRLKNLAKPGKIAEVETSR